MNWPVEHVDAFERSWSWREFRVFCLLADYNVIPFHVMLVRVSSVLCLMQSDLMSPALMGGVCRST
jgi:hypothetical protein